MSVSKRMQMHYKLIKVILLLMISIGFHPAIARADAGDDPVLTKVMLDQLEVRDVGSDNANVWDGQGWIGKDLTKLWIKSEGERASGKTDEAELQLLYSKAVAKYWDFQVGVGAGDLWQNIREKGIAQTRDERSMWNQMRMSDRDLADVS